MHGHLNVEVLFQIKTGSNQVVRHGSVTQCFFLCNNKYKYKISVYKFRLIPAIFRPMTYLCIEEQSVTEQGPSWIAVQQLMSCAAWCTV